MKLGLCASMKLAKLVLQQKLQLAFHKVRNYEALRFLRGVSEISTEISMFAFFL